MVKRVGAKQNTIRKSKNQAPSIAVVKQLNGACLPRGTTPSGAKGDVGWDSAKAKGTDRESCGAISRPSLRSQRDKGGVAKGERIKGGQGNYRP